MSAKDVAVKMLADTFRLMNISRVVFGPTTDNVYKLVGAKLPIRGEEVKITRQLVDEAIEKAFRDHVSSMQDAEFRKENRQKF